MVLVYGRDVRGGLGAPRLAADKLDVSSAACPVIEDSPPGVQAALAARMWCIVVTTPFTQAAIHADWLVAKRRIVDDATALAGVACQMAAERGQD